MTAQTYFKRKNILKYEVTNTLHAKTFIYE